MNDDGSCHTESTERTEKKKLPKEFKAVQRISTWTIPVRFESFGKIPFSMLSASLWQEIGWDRDPESSARARKTAPVAGALPSLHLRRSASIRGQVS